MVPATYFLPSIFDEEGGGTFFKFDLYIDSMMYPNSMVYYGGIMYNGDIGPYCKPEQIGSSVDSSVPTILLSQVRFPRKPSMLFSI